MLELSVVRKLLPKNHRSMITQEYLDKIEASVNNSAIAEQFKDNFISYTNVLNNGKYKMEDYVNAVKYVSFKLLGYSNRDSYISTFPDRYAKLERDNPEYIDQFVCAYNKTKLVNAIYEQTMVPTYVLNAPLHQEALNELAKMIHDPSVRGMAKVKACEAVLNATKQPEVVKGELQINVGQSDTVAELREIVEAMSIQQRANLENGYIGLKELAESKIIDVEVEDEE